MSQEIERKFLVKEIPPDLTCKTIRQGYLQSEKTRAVRIRTIHESKSKNAFLTIKGASNKEGTSRYEFEIEIPFSDATHLLTLCDRPLIEKTRFIYKHDGLIWEIDEFHGVNDGLVVAEVELESEDQKINRPDFVKEEVTGQKKYYNLMLIKNPYSVWGKETSD